MRVIAGRAGGRKLLGPPKGVATRPTSDKVREAIFGTIGERIAGARVLDLFAGTGALGIEALSRGAHRVTMVESEPALCAVIEKNLEAVGMRDEAYVVCRDVRRAAGAVAREGPYHIVLIDPPYGLGLEIEALRLLAQKKLLAPGAFVVVEHASREPLQLPASLSALFVVQRAKHYGDTAVTCYLAGGASAPQDPAVEAQSVATTPSPSEEPVTQRTAIYPGSFDPMTLGHLDVIHRSLALFDQLVIAVASNVRKQSLFTVPERIALVREVVGDDPRVQIDTFDGLLVQYAARKGAVAVVRGLRAVADFEYEFEMASMNRRLAPNLETVFLMTHESYFYVSSHLVKEVASLGGDIDAFVPPAVAAKLKARIEEIRKR